MHTQSVLLSLALVAGSAGLPAQNLELDVVGGSFPGSLQVSMETIPLFQAAIIAYSASPGPTPLSVFAPGDPRSLDLGLVDGYWLAPLVPTGTFAPPPANVPNLPALMDLPFYFQGITFIAPPVTALSISNSRTIWLAPSGAFRDRGNTLISGRAFSQVLPRADGSWMVVGGGVGALLAQLAQRDCEIYNPKTDLWGVGPLMTVERALHTATRLNDGRWLLVAGVDRSNDPQATAEIYDPVTDTFSAVASMAQARMGHTANLLPDGRVLVTGGMNDLNGPNLDPILSTLDTTEIYDPTTNQWSSGPSLRTPRVGHSTIVKANGDILFVGGVSFDDLIILQLPALRRNTDLYSVGNGTITGGPSMSAPRALAGLVDIGGGRHLMSGGVSNITLLPPGATTTASAEIYDEGSDSWTNTGTMAQSRGLHSGFALDANRFLFVGGGDGDILNPTALDSCEIYDATTGTWSPGPVLTTPRAAYGIYRTPAGQVHFIGGGGGPNGSVTQAAEFYYF